MKPEQEIKQFAIQRGADLVGIASVADINRYAPAGHRPDDILTGAKSVIVIAGQVVLRGAWRSPDYRTLYYNRDFPRIHTSIAIDTAKLIESRHGYYSIGDIPPQIGFCPSLSLKLCAEMAGLGSRSLAGGIILNREFGLLSLAACITTMPLTPDGPIEDIVCPHSSCVKLWERRRSTPCLAACPECLSGEIENSKIKWMRYDRRICSTRAQTMSVGVFQRMLIESANEADPEVRRNILLGSFSRSVMETITSGKTVAQCCECLRNCPVSVRARSLKGKKRFS